MIYKTLKKGSPPSTVIFKNKKRKGRAINNYRRLPTTQNRRNKKIRNKRIRK